MSEDKMKMELEEAIKILTDDNKTYQLNKLLNDTLNIESPKYYQAIETVLQALNNFIFVIEEMTQALENSISKKKVEDIIEELDSEFNNYQVGVNCSQDDYYILSDKYAFTKEKLQELLEEIIKC